MFSSAIGSQLLSRRGREEGYTAIIEVKTIIAQAAASTFWAVIKLRNKF
jgi:hypothetical protein